MRKLLIYLIGGFIFWGISINLYAKEVQNDKVAVTEPYDMNEEEDPQYGRENGYIDAEFLDINAFSNDSDNYIHNERFNDYLISNVIDVSKYQGNIDWNAVKKAGIDYAIIRAGFRGYGESASLNIDTNFEKNINGAIAAGMEVGVYFFSQAITEEEACEEAELVLELIDGYDIKLPVAIDFEYASSKDGLIGRLYDAGLTREAATQICRVFCATVEDKGYTAMVYANKNMLENGLFASEIKKDYKIWLANYTTSTTYEGDYDFWQYTDSGSVNGIAENVDMSFWYQQKNAECTESEIGTSCPSTHFKDLDLTQWYHRFVDYVVSNKYMNGTWENQFGPNIPTTRAMIVTILYNMHGEKVGEDVILQCRFEDVPKDTYYAAPVAWAALNGVVAGISDTEFSPETEITREQMIVMLYNYARFLGLNINTKKELSEFTDYLDVSSWALEPMKWASAEGLISGIPENGKIYLQPQGKTIRVQAATLIHNFCKYRDLVPLSMETCEIVENTEGNGYVFQIDINGISEENVNNQYYIIQVDSYGNLLSEDAEMIEFTKEDPASKINIALEINREEVKDLLMDKYAVAYLNENQQYQLLTEPVSISNLNEIALNKDNYVSVTSKKGLQGIDIEGAGETNSKHTLFNIDLADVLCLEADENAVEYHYKGKTYYFSDLNNYVGTFKELVKGYEHYINVIDNEYNRVEITVCLLLGYDREKNFLIDPAARTSGKKYYTLNVREKAARETFEAMFLYLGELFGQKDCYVTNWILGNEVNSSKAYNYSGSLDFNTYIECYATAFRLLYNGVKAQKTANNVYISLDNGWNAIPDTYAGKATLDKFAECIDKIDSNVKWNIAYHGYSHPLTRNDFWNDNVNTTFNINTNYISMHNISVLTDYVEQLEQIYGKEKNSIRVILSEQGYNAANKADQMAESQARALARGYYMAEFNERIDAFIIRAIIDDENEMRGNLFFGLKNWQDVKRITFYTYEYMDSSLEHFASKPVSEISSQWNWKKVETAKNILCGTAWENIIPGFSRDKLEKMY